MPRWPRCRKSCRWRRASPWVRPLRNAVDRPRRIPRQWRDSRRDPARRALSAPRSSVLRSRRFIHDRAAARTGAMRGGREESLENRRQLRFDVGDLGEFFVKFVAAAFAVPLETIALAGTACAFDDQAHGIGRTPRRVRHVRRQQENLAFGDGHVHAFAILDGGERDATLELVKEFLAGLDVEVLAAVRPTDHHDDELAVGEYLFVAHGRLEQVTVFVDPALEMEGLEFPHAADDMRWTAAM